MFLNLLSDLGEKKTLFPFVLSIDMVSCCWSIIIELYSVYSIIMASSSNIIQAMINIILEDEEEGGIAIEAVEGTWIRCEIMAL